MLNPTLAKRVEDQVALADASMAYDLNWLTDLSVPLFVAYIGILAVHELAHRVVAGFYEVSVVAERAYLIVGRYPISGYWSGR